MKHKELCQIGARWLRTSCLCRCPVVISELVTQANETPDVIGFNAMYSVMVEVKTSRSDFLRDKKKIQRIFPELGVGDFRLYLSPEGIIKPEDLPEKWGLLWVDEKGKCKTMVSIFKGNVNSDNPNRFKKNAQAEREIMYSQLRRWAGERRIRRAVQILVQNAFEANGGRGDAGAVILK